MNKTVICLIMGTALSLNAAPLLKTGQIVEYYSGDDGTYQMGIERSYTRNIEGVVSDRVTGLEWQDSYFDNNENIKTGNWDDALNYCSTLTLDGSGWRLPSNKELRTLVAVDYYDLSIDPIFQSTHPYSYWTSTESVKHSSEAWIVHFQAGRDTDKSKDRQDTSIRCVRGNLLASSSFTRDNTHETVYDSSSNLTWQDNAIVASQKLSWEEAINYCEDLDFANRNDWRLPNIKELGSIKDLSQAPYAIDPIFKNVHYNFYWSSSTNVNDPSSAWYINFYWGYNYNEYNKDGTDLVRCVRGENNDNDPSTGFTQEDLDQAKQDAIAQCQADPVSCNINTGYSEEDINSAIEEGKQICIDNPEVCGIVIDTCSDVPGVTITQEPRVTGETKRTVTIKWRTDIKSDSVVEYGIEETDLTAGRSKFQKNHVVRLKGLDKGTTYQYRIVSTTKEGEVVSSEIYSFTTR